MEPSISWGPSVIDEMFVHGMGLCVEQITQGLMMN